MEHWSWIPCYSSCWQGKHANAGGSKLESLHWLLRYVCLPLRQRLSAVMMTVLIPFLYQRYLIKCLLQLCPRETAGKPVERNQRGQAVSIIMPQPVAAPSMELSPHASSAEATLSITVHGFSFIYSLRL